MESLERFKSFRIVSIFNMVAAVILVFVKGKKMRQNFLILDNDFLMTIFPSNLVKIGSTVHHLMNFFGIQNGGRYQMLLGLQHLGLFWGNGLGSILPSC